jgi:excisionase family DNA binding protein
VTLVMTNQIGVREAADLVGVHENTIRNWVKAGILCPVVKTPGGHSRFNPEDVATLADAISTTRSRMIEARLLMVEHLLLGAQEDVERLTAEREELRQALEGRRESG